MGFYRGTLSLSSTISLALQFIDRIEYLHSKYFMHRDIKPENFMIGRDANSRIAYLIDYGLARRYRDPSTKMHILYKDNKTLTGTARYASINTHVGIEQSRRDDLECLGFTLVYMLKGKLPWQGIKVSDKNERYRRIHKKEKTTSIDILCKGLPTELADFFTHCRSLRFDDKSDYGLVKKLFADLFDTKGYNKNSEYDWITFKIDLDHLLGRDLSNDTSEDYEKFEIPYMR